MHAGGAAIGTLIVVQGVAIIVLLYQQIAGHFIPLAIEKPTASGQSDAAQQWARPLTDDEGQDLTIEEQTPGYEQQEGE